MVPLDASDTAEKVISYVIDEAQLYQAKVILMRVIAPLRQSLLSSPASINLAMQHVEVIANDYLENIAKEFEAESIDVETVVVHGGPAQKTLETARENHCDLIIIGTHGETGAYQWRFGSVANKIIKAKTSIPVLVITTE